MYTSGTTGRPKGVMLHPRQPGLKNLAHLVEFGFRGADLGLPADRSTTSAPSTSPPPR
jgi:acyl-CoA synthetase (AMP-forming)/AMP-acid ligase II